ncbi:membrane protein insertion efficiency factor YidD [Candidatus Protochlamydia amoebophila]|uniref:Putative membrane protein insertion efficiency factor n=1 Tax=Candidatus Protochlamydia amoebophila TaxID=362787 RepID=A0A0C1JI19_9BACT|nr:membrane protein insertion efficiency factor YidD [Candidatus Protochlamydia amoebophila]KIC71045.1 putative membrane protein insertion efficiency factor [Candidatus Protochlamydia amoebophila]
MYSFLFIAPLLSDPWGKDADLISPPFDVCPSSSSSLLAKLGMQAIRFHQEVISPADGPRSHFIPSSSQYTLNAMRKYGFFRGYTMGCDRLMRENDDPWIYRTILDPNGKSIKWDPVP